MFSHFRRLGAAAVLVLVAATAAACGSSNDGSSTATSGQSSASTSSGGSKPAGDANLRAKFPQKIQKAGALKTVMILYPPFVAKGKDGSTLEGLDIDLAKAFEKVLGLDVTVAIAPSITEVYAGLASGRYDLVLGPVPDTARLQTSYDFVDWFKDDTIFGVAKGNPKKIVSGETACGHTIAVLQGSNVVPSLEKVSKACPAGKPIKIVTFPEQSSAVLAVQSGRVDATQSSVSSLTSWVAKSNGALELTGRGSVKIVGANAAGLLEGTNSVKGNGVAEAVLEVFKALKQDGTYDALLKKYGFGDLAIDSFGINLAKK